MCVCVCMCVRERVCEREREVRTSHKSAASNNANEKIDTLTQRINNLKTYTHQIIF